jgi:hypothetical protein
VFPGDRVPGLKPEGGDGGSVLVSVVSPSRQWTASFPTWLLLASDQQRGW